MMHEISEFFLWHFIMFDLSFDFFLRFFFFFLIFQNQSAAGNVIQLIKDRKV